MILFDGEPYLLGQNKYPLFVGLAEGPEIQSCKFHSIRDLIWYVLMWLRNCWAPILLPLVQQLLTSPTAGNHLHQHE